MVTNRTKKVARSLIERGMVMKEKLCIWLAWKLPRGLVYWCAIRLMAHATTGDYGHVIVPELLAMDALKRWDLNHNWLMEVDALNLPLEVRRNGN